ncbi:MAG: type II secretion system protein GspN [Myxococcota bacterium]
MATKQTNKRSRWHLLGYAVWFQLLFVVMFYWTFPIKSFQGQLQQQLQSALSGAMDQQVQLSIGSMSLWRLSGLRLKQVQLKLPNDDGEPTTTIDFDHMQARLDLLSSLIGNTTISWGVRLHQQSIDGQLSVNKQSNVSFFSFNISKMQLDKVALLTAMSGLPTKGELTANARMQLGNSAKDLQGSFHLSWQQAAIGPGNMVLPAFAGIGGALQLPAIQLGNITIAANAQQGKLQLQKLEFSGGDLQADIKGDGKLRSNWQRTALSGKGWFLLAPEFLKKNPSLKAILSMSPQLQRAKDEQNRYPFSVRGTIAWPQFSFGAS